MEPGPDDFATTYRDLGPSVLGYLRSQGAADPEGATNDVFLRVFKGWDRFSGSEANLRSWVFTVAHNLIVDQRRYVARRPVTIESEPLESPGGDAEIDALAALAKGELRRTLNLLPALQRDVLLLRFVADLSLEDTARVTGRTVGGVKSVQHRALAAVRRLLGENLKEAVSL